MHIVLLAMPEAIVYGATLIAFGLIWNGMFRR